MKSPFRSPKPRVKTSDQLFILYLISSPLKANNLNFLPIKSKEELRIFLYMTAAAKIQSFKCIIFLVSASIILNLYFIVNLYEGSEWNLSWSSKAAREAEAVAAISCSGHGRAYLDSQVFYGNQPVCECNSCFSGPDCSLFLPGCAADAERYFSNSFSLKQSPNFSLQKRRKWNSEHVSNFFPI